jgi:hypothetical protein
MCVGCVVADGPGRVIRTGVEAAVTGLLWGLEGTGLFLTLSEHLYSQENSDDTLINDINIGLSQTSGRLHFPEIHCLPEVHDSPMLKSFPIVSVACVIADDSGRVTKPGACRLGIVLFLEA